MNPSKLNPFQTEPPLSYTEIQHTIRVALSALSTHGLEACLFGSAAMLAYGMGHRLPKDIDLLILNASPVQTDETIKDLLVSSTPTATPSSSGFFFLIDSRRQGATHRILWYALRPTGTSNSGSSSTKPSSSREHRSKKSKHKRAEPDPGSQKAPAPSSASMSREQDLENPEAKAQTTSDQGRSRACKIDILLPGPKNPLDIPHIPKDRLFFDSSVYFLSYASASSFSSNLFPSGSGSGTSYLQSNPTRTTMLNPDSAPIVTPISYIPFLGLLSLKLRAWVDHSQPLASEAEDKMRVRGRVVGDEADIEELLRIVGLLRTSRNMGRGMGIGFRDGHGIGGGGDGNGGVGNEEMWTWTHAGFRTRKEARRAVGAYVKKWPSTKSAWTAIGFGA